MLCKVYNDALVACQAHPDMYISEAGDRALAAVALEVLRVVREKQMAQRYDLDQFSLCDEYQRLVAWNQGIVAATGIIDQLTAELGEREG